MHRRYGKIPRPWWHEYPWKPKKQKKKKKRIAIGGRRSRGKKKKGETRKWKLWVAGEPHSSVVEYIMQGNPMMSRRHQLLARRALRRRPILLQLLREFWQELPLRGGTLHREEYDAFYVAMCEAVAPGLDRGTLQVAMDADWADDCLGQETMTRNAFEQSMFELADLWCHTTEAAEYANFLDMLLKNYRSHVLADELEGGLSPKDKGILQTSITVGRPGQGLMPGGLCEGDAWYHQLKAGTKKEQKMQLRTFTHLFKHL